MKKISIAIMLSLVGSSLFSQTSKIENTRVIISTSTDTMYVKYDLTGKHEAYITLEVKDLDNRIIQPKHISGDIRKNIKPGKDRTIIWDINADRLNLSGLSLKVKVRGIVFIATKEKNNYTQSNWGFALNFFSGYGIFTGGLTRTYRNTVPFGCEWDVYYRRLVLYLTDYIGFSRTIRDLPYSGGNWAKGSQVRVFIPKASLGCVLMDNKIIKLAPFAGIAATDIGPPEPDIKKMPDLSQVDLKFTTTYSLGLNIDFKLISDKTSVGSAGRAQNYLFIRVRYSYDITQFKNKYPEFDGNMHNLTIGIGLRAGR